MIKRGDVTDITLVFERLEMKSLISNQHITRVNMALSYHSLVF